MTEYLAAIKGANYWHWGDSPYQWYFYIGIVLVLIFERRKLPQIVFGIFPMVFLVCIYNPFFEKAIQVIFGEGYYYQYFSRMFTFIPLIYGIACGIMQLVRKVNGWFKLLFVLAVSIGVVFTGTNFYHEDWMKPAVTLEKVPADSFQVIEALKKDERKICVAFPSPLNVYIRQIDAKIITPYGRYLNELGSLLDQETPNVETIMLLAGQQATDYVVVEKREASHMAFTEAGYSPWAETDKYQIYAVEGVPRIIRTLNERNQIIETGNVDSEGNYIPYKQGYSKELYEYDDWGYVSKKTYTDDEGRKFLIDNKYCAMLLEHYVFSGFVKSVSYLNLNDQKILMNGCYETRFKYGSNRRISEESYYDDSGRMMINENTLYAYKKLEYDNSGRLSSEKYYGTNWKLKKNQYGYAGFNRTYGENRNITCDTYLDESGMPFMLNGSHASTLWETDDLGNEILVKYYDTTGNPVCRDAGYAEVRRSFADHNMIEEAYFDELGNPTRSYEGFHRIVKEYDGSNHVIEERTYDTEGNLVMGTRGYAIVRRTWDDEMCLNEEFFDTDGVIMTKENASEALDNEM